MKYLISIILLATTLISCTKNDLVLKPKYNPNFERCGSFGVTIMGAVKRGINKGKPPRNPTQPPTNSGTYVLYLDFDGHTVSNTSWNVNGDIICEHSNLSTIEQQRILDTTKYAYACFPNVIVSADERVFYSVPSERRMRLILTTTSDWYGAAGGTAYTNSLTWYEDVPCFVFTALLNYNTKQITEAAIHELGHTAGLRHQATGTWDNGIWTLTSQYNYGSDCCAPRMGVAYYRTGKWWKGYNPYGAIQDDVAILTSLFGSNGSCSYMTN
jgi:hypothetical protein